MKYDDTPSFTDKLRQSSPTYIVRSTMNVNNVNRVPLVKVEAGLLGVLPTKTSQLTNDDFTVKDQYYVHTDNNFTDVYRDMLLTFDSSLSELAGEVIYRRGYPDQTIEGNLDITGTLFIGDDTTIDGNLDVYGTITHHGTFRTSNDFIVLREQENEGLENETYAGIITHLYDGANDGGIIWGNDGIGRIGDIEYQYKTITPIPEDRNECNGLYYKDGDNYVIVEQDTDLSTITVLYKKQIVRGTTQALATRLDANDENMVDTKLAVWDEANQTFTAPDFSYHQTNDTQYIDEDDKTFSFLDSIVVDQNGRVSTTNVKTLTLHRTWRPVTVNGEEMLISIDDKTLNFQDGSSIKIEQEDTDANTSTVIISIDNNIPDNTVESTDAFQFLYYNTEGIVTGIKSTAYQQTLKINGNILGTLYGTNTNSADIHLYGAEYQIEETTDKRYLLGSQNLTDMARTNTDARVYSENGKLFSNSSEVVNLADDQTIDGTKTYTTEQIFNDIITAHSGVVYSNNVLTTRLYLDDSGRLVNSIDDTEFLLVDRLGKVYSNNSEVVNIDDNQTIEGDKQFNGLVSIGGDLMPTTNETQDIGSETNRFNNLYVKTLYATDFYGELTGNAATADQVNHDLLLASAPNTTITYNGSADRNLSDYYVDRFNAQSIGGVKTFNNNVIIGSSTTNANLTISGDLTIEGNITQNGSTYETHAEQVYTTNDYIYLREGATGSLGSGYSGFEFIRYDGTNNGRLVIDVNGTARVGDVGDEQPLATRDEETLMADNGLVWWDSTGVRLKTITPSASGYFLTAGNGTEPVWIDPADLLIGEASKTTHSITFDNGVGTTDTFDGSANKTLVGNYVDMYNAQTIGGVKTLADTLNTDTILPKENNVQEIGSDTLKYLNIYATTFRGNATSADKTNHYLTLQTSSTATANFDGSANYVLSTYYVDRFTTQTIGGLKTFTDNTQFNGNVEVDGTFGVDNATTLRSTLAVDGNTTLGGTLQVDGTTNLTGATTLEDTLEVDGATILNSTLNVTENTTLNANLNVGGNSTLDGTLQVEGQTTHNDNVVMNATTQYELVNGTDGTLEDFITFDKDTGLSRIYRVANNGNLILQDTTGITIIPTSAATNGYTFTDTVFEPGIDNHSDLGTITDRWKNLYLYGDVYRRNSEGTMVSLTDDIQNLVDDITLVADNTANTITLYNNKSEVLSTLTQSDVRGVIATDVTANNDKYEFVHYNSTGLITGQALQVYNKAFVINGTSRNIITDNNNDLTPVYAPTEAATEDNAIIVWSAEQNKPIWVSNTSSLIFENSLTYDNSTDTLHVLAAYQGYRLDQKKVEKELTSGTTNYEVANNTTTQWLGRTTNAEIGDTAIETLIGGSYTNVPARGVAVDSSSVAMANIGSTDRAYVEMTDQAIQLDTVVGGTTRGLTINSNGLTVLGSVIPTTTDTYNLGSATQRFSNIYADTTHSGNIEITEGTVEFAENTIAENTDPAYYVGLNALGSSTSNGNLVYLSKADIRESLGIVDIEEKIPTDTTSTNQLVNKSYVDDTFLPLAGGEMDAGGNIIFPNNTGLIARDTSGTQHTLIRMNHNNDIYVGYTGRGIYLNSSTLYPSQNNTMNLGSSSVKWKDLYLAGNANIDGNADIGGNLIVDGTSTLNGNTTIIGNVTIEGDITQNGSTYETHAQQVYTTNDYIYLREGATGGLGSGYSGLEFVKYDGTNSGRLVIDQYGTAKVGDVGDEQPLATRADEEDMTSNAIVYWNSTNNRLETSDYLTTNGFVTLTTAQTINGQKTFTQELIKSQSSGYAGYAINNTGYTRGNIPTNTIGLGRWIVRDSGNQYLSYLQTQVNSNGSVVTELLSRQATTAGGSTYQEASIGLNTSRTGSFVYVGGRLQPHTNNTYDLGTKDFRWRNAYLQKIDTHTLTVQGDANIVNGQGLVLTPASAGSTYCAFKFYAQGDDVFVEKQKVEGGADYQKLLPLDSELSLTSINAVQNNVVTEALNNETSARQNADTNLQNQINSINYWIKIDNPGISVVGNNLVSIDRVYIHINADNSLDFNLEISASGTTYDQVFGVLTFALPQSITYNATQYNLADKVYQVTENSLSNDYKESIFNYNGIKLYHLYSKRVSRTTRASVPGDEYYFPKNITIKCLTSFIKKG